MIATRAVQISAHRGDNVRPAVSLQPMSAALIAALFFTVALLVVTAYFLMGSLPLLILKHDTPLDSRFIRGFYDTLLPGRTAHGQRHGAVLRAWPPGPSMPRVAAALALLAYTLRHRMIPKMDSLHQRIQASEVTAIAGFRRMHVAAIVLNAAQLVLIVLSLIALSMQMR